MARPEYHRMDPRDKAVVNNCSKVPRRIRSGKSSWPVFTPSLHKHKVRKGRDCDCNVEQREIN